MSEQETSRSVGSSSTCETPGESQGDTSQGSPPGQCCTVLSTCISSDSGMGNTIFSSPEHYEDVSDCSHDKETKNCDFPKQESGGEVAKDTSSGSSVSLSGQKDAMHFDHEQSQSSEAGNPPEQGLKTNVTVFKKKNDLEVQQEPHDAGKGETEHPSNSSVDKGRETHDIASEKSEEEKSRSITETSNCDKRCESDGKSISAEEKVKDTESTCNSIDACESQPRSPGTSTPETQELEVVEREEGVEVLLKCIDKEQHSPNLSEVGGCDKPQSDCQDVAKGESSVGNNLGASSSNQGMGGYSLGMVGTSLETENCHIGMESCSVSVEGCNVAVQGCSVGMQGCSMGTEGCYNTGDNLVCAGETIRDTDSEVGDSCCSDDQEHGEACRGENGCVHRVAGDALEQNWDYVVDEEFNVPRKPIFNGSADQLDRRSSLKRKASEEPEESKPAKCKRGIQFEGVTVFYFPRSQGFTCVPSQGGSSLGMSRRHSHIRQFSLAEHAVEQRRAHREYLLRLRQQRSARGRIEGVANWPTVQGSPQHGPVHHIETYSIYIEHGESSSRGSSSEDSEENSEEASDLSDSELDADSYYFLQPLPIRQRRALLRQAGICHIEGLEKEECKDIRMSREMCGCQCKVYCDPDTCQCAQGGIKCQVDRHNFPCGCSREGCGNSYGRIEFNPIRVRTHFISTLMRLELEKRHNQQQLQQQQQQHHQQQQQQQQEWEQQQQRAKWLASSSAPPNGFSGTSGGLTGGNLPFFEGSRDSGGLAVADVNKFNSSVEMGACVGSMNTSLYPHFESRQMLGPTGPSVYIQHDSVGDYNSGTCSVFGGLGATFDPSGAYGSCHNFPSASVVPTPPQVAPSQPAPPEAYNSLSKFTNSTTSLVPASFPYSGGVAPSATASVPTVNCSYPQNNFCMTAVHDNTNGTVFGQYHEASTVTQNLFKTGVNECGDFQPNFEALSSSPASTDKADRYIPAPSLVGPVKEMCGGAYTMKASASSQCSEVVDSIYKVAGGGSSSSCSSSPHHTIDDTPELRLPQLPVSSAPPPPLSYDHGSPVKDTPGVEDPTDTAENLGEIVKKSMVETVSA